MKVLQIGMWWSGDRTGGLDRVFHSLVENLPALNIAVIGLVEGPAESGRQSGGVVQTYQIRARWLFARLLGVRRTIRATLKASSPDVIASHFSLYALASIDLIPAGRLIVHFHGPWSAEAAAEGESRVVVACKRFLEGLVYRRAARVIVLSESFGRLITNEYGVDPRRVHVVPGPIDIARFSNLGTKLDARKRLGLAPERPILVAVRRLSHRMGLDRLIDAMVAVCERHPSVLLLIAGKGKLRPELELQVVTLGLTKQVQFLGFVSDDDLPLLYRAADLNVVPTVALEGFGLVAAEALAAGTPSLVTPVGGLPEVVRELSAALILDDPSSNSISARITAILSHACELPNSDACRQYAAERFSEARVAAMVAEIYEQLVVENSLPSQDR